MGDIREIERLALTNLSDNGHSLLSPSGSGMWSRCAGSCIGLHESRLNSLNNIASTEGTEGHFLLELCLTFMVSPHEIINQLPNISDQFKYEVFKWREGIVNNPSNSKDVIDFVKKAHDRIVKCNFTDEMKEHIHRVYLKVKTYVDDGWVLIPELKVSLLAYLGHTQCDGTSDIVLFKGDKLIVADLKYGKGIPVSPVSNRQETLYALGCIQYIYETYGIVINDVELVICQPRINKNDWESWKTSYVDLSNFTNTHLRDQSVKALVAIGQPEKVNSDWFNPSQKACMWCHRKRDCTAYNDKAKSDILALFDKCDSPVATVGSVNVICKDEHTAELTDVEINDIINSLPFIESWLKGVYAEAEARTIKGSRNVGLKVVEGRVSRSIKGTTDQQKVAQLVKIGVPYQDAIVIKPKTPAMLEKIKLTEEVSVALKDIIVIQKGNCITAPIDDSRSDVNSLSTMQKHFEDFDKKQLNNK